MFISKRAGVYLPLSFARLEMIFVVVVAAARFDIVSGVI